MITFEKVHKSLSGKKVLDGIDLNIKSGETLAIVGFSGAGKSVMLKHIVKLMTPDTGGVYIDGVSLLELSSSDLRKIRSKFGMLFQGSALLQSLSVYENIALPLRQKAFKEDEEIDILVNQRLNWVELNDVSQKFPVELSGGMQKRVGLARATIMNPSIILYDEPTSGLDPVTSRKIDKLIVKLNKEMNVTSVVVTHDLISALSIGSKILMLHEGKIIEYSSPDEFVKSSVYEVQSFLRAQRIY